MAIKQLTGNETDEEIEILAKEYVEILTKSNVDVTVEAVARDLRRRRDEKAAKG